MANEKVKPDKKDIGALEWCDRLLDLCRKGNFKTGAVDETGVDVGESNTIRIINEFKTWRAQQ